MHKLVCLCTYTRVLFVNVRASDIVCEVYVVCGRKRVCAYVFYEGMCMRCLLTANRKK